MHTSSWKGGANFQFQVFSFYDKLSHPSLFCLKFDTPAHLPARIYAQNLRMYRVGPRLLPIFTSEHLKRGLLDGRKLALFIEETIRVGKKQAQKTMFVCPEFLDNLAWQPCSKSWAIRRPLMLLLVICWRRKRNFLKKRWSAEIFNCWKTRVKKVTARLEFCPKVN